MPIYEYRCGSCGHTLDALQKLDDAPLSDCPECSDPALKRLISAPSFRLKGSGWYETDFKSDKERRRNLAEGAGEKAGGDDKAAQKGDSKDDSKGGSKADAKPPTESGANKESKKSDGASTKSSTDKKGSGSEAA